MVSFSKIRLAAALVACIAFLSMRLVGDHLHLCLDGSEPAVSVHAYDGEIHHAEVGIDAPHEDVDVDMMRAMFKSACEALLLLGALLLLRILPRVSVPRTAFPPVPCFDSRFHDLRPPLRGPPR